MTDRGILFSGTMVRALLDGSKTQTRRAVKGIPLSWLEADLAPDFVALPENRACPYGQPGDRLWVRETFIAFGRWETRYSEKKQRDEWHFIDMTNECDRAYQHAASNPEVPLAKGRGPLPGWYTRPAIHMPRVASRILLEITGVRIERLQDISPRDAREEGLHRYPYDWRDSEFPLDDVAYEPFKGFGTRYSCASQAYRALWESINGDGSWDANPWVWVVEFRRIAS